MKRQQGLLNQRLPKGRKTMPKTPLPPHKSTIIRTGPSPTPLLMVRKPLHSYNLPVICRKCNTEQFPLSVDVRTCLKHTQ